MEIGWLTAFVDMPTATFDAGARFWCDVTGSRLSSPRGDDDQFATLLPPDGDAYLRVQRLDADTPRIHLDLHVPARELDIERSPGGFTYCVVGHHGESNRPQPVQEPAANIVDQICIDVPAPLFDDEVSYWSDLTGWAIGTGTLTEFAWLEQPAGLPLRLVFQRLGERSGPVRAHLDLSCGANVDVVAAEHVRLGAHSVAATPYWTTLRDPAGLPYCLTQRDPVTGVR